MEIKIKDPNYTAFVFHPEKGKLLVNPDQVASMLEQGWYDRPVTKEVLESKVKEIEQKISDSEKSKPKPKKEKHNEKQDA